MFALSAFMFVNNNAELTGHVVLDEILEVPEVVCESVKVFYEEPDSIIVQEEYVDTVLEKVFLDYEILRQDDYSAMINNQLGRFAIFGVKNLDSQSSEFTIKIIFDDVEEFVFSKVLGVGEVLLKDAFLPTGSPEDVSVSYVVETGYKLLSVEKTLLRNVELPILISKYRTEEVCK